MKDTAISPPMKASEVNAGIFITMLMVFAAGFSMFFMRSQSLGLDEAQSLWQSAHSFSGILYVVAQDVHVPLYHFILHIWQIVFGNGVPAARALSLLFFLPTIPLVYLLGRIAYGKMPGLWAAAFFTLSPFTNWYGSVVRMYSLLALLTVINQIFFILIYKGREERRTLYWVGFFVSAFLGMYTHYFFFFSLIAEAIFFFGYRKFFPEGSIKNVIAIAVILAILFAPWLFYVRSVGGFGAYTEPKLAPPTTVDVFNTGANFFFGFQADVVNALILSLWPLITLFLFISLQKNKRIPPETVFFLIVTIGPIIAAALLSYVISPFYLSRYFIGVFPAFCLFVSWLMSLYPKRTEVIIKAGLVLAMLISLGIQTSNAASPIKEDYSDVGNYLNKNTDARDIVALSTPFTIYPVEYYYDGEAQVTTIPGWNQLQSGPIPPFNMTNLITTTNALATTHDRIWLVLSYDQGYESQVLSYFDTHYARLSASTFSPNLAVYSYQLRYTADATMSSTLSLARSILGPSDGGQFVAPANSLATK